jgi:2-keto-4-pentenoate hydratase
MDLEGTTESLAQRLFAAQAAGAAPITVPPDLAPASVEAAYAVQERLRELRGGGPAGWKVGSNAPDGPILGAPLPADRIFPSPGTLRRADYAVVGLELEIVFCFGRSFAPSSQDYGAEEVIAGIASFCAAIEVVSSRLAGWPQVDKLLQLADLQNHGALIVGGQTKYDSHFPFLAPKLDFRFNGERITPNRPANSAGDPRRMLAWAVNRCTTRGRSFAQGTMVTTGTYTGCFFVTRPGTALGEIVGLPPVQLQIA